MNCTINELRKYGVKLSDNDIIEGLIQLGHEVEEVTDMNIEGLVIGEVVECDAHPDSEKLSLTKVNIGSEQIQIVCGAPNVRKGLKVIVATLNTYIPTLDLEIKPVKLRGEASNGMLCSLAELGLSKSVLNQKDIDGICELPSDAPVGMSACEYLGLNDKILDISLTADRGDCQNYAGLINDLKALSNNQETFTEFKFENNLWTSEKQNFVGEKQISANVLEETTIYYSTQVIENVNITDSSIFEQIFLMKNGIKPQNNVVDNTNYGLLTYGIPTHAYDADKIKSTVTVCKTTKEELFVGLDGNEYNLAKDTLVVKDEEKIIAVAGVMGSFETRVTKDTKNILFELAIFDSSLVRLGSKQLGFKTDASIRYEKGVNYGAIDVTRKMLVNNIGENANSEYVACDNTTKAKEIKLNFDSVKKVLGIDIEKNTIKSILKDLSFKALNEDEFSVLYQVPTHRHDIDFENDLIEEVIRVYGIDKIDISTHLASFNNIKPIQDNKDLIVERKLENAMLASGMSQVVTYSLTSEQELTKFTTNSLPPVKLAYPISNERCVYRQSLISNLIETAKYNLDRQMDHSCIFEIANTYTQENEIVQKRLFSGLVTGRCEDVYMGSKRNFDFYDLKSMMSQGLLGVLENIHFEAVDLGLDELNKYATANVYCDNQLLGYIATVHPAYVKKAKYPIYVFELDFDQIVKCSKLTTDYKVVTNQPISERDFTMNVSKEVTYSQITSIIEGTKYVENIKLIDIYEGDQIEDGMKAVTIKVRFALEGQTLTNEMVSEDADLIIENIKNKGFKF